MKSKYLNKKIAIKNEKFDSKKEYSIWVQLKRMEELGVISNLKRQVRYLLIPAQYEEIETTNKYGKIKRKKKMVERECSYVADFVYTNNKTQEIIVADCKSDFTERNKEFIIKKKLMLYKYGIKIKILK